MTSIIFNVSAFADAVVETMFVSWFTNLNWVITIFGITIILLNEIVMKYIYGKEN